MKIEYSRQLVRVAKSVTVEQFEAENKTIVISAKDCGDHLEFWALMPVS